jgi:hypothetical protein
MSFSISLNSGDIVKNINRLPEQVDGYVHAVVSRQATKATGYMKQNAKWRDRTGNARAGMTAEAGWVPFQSHSITFFYRVAYGIFLETRWAGRFAIIGPTIQKFGPETMQLLNRMFDKLGRL